MTVMILIYTILFFLLGVVVGYDFAESKKD